MAALHTFCTTYTERLISKTWWLFQRTLTKLLTTLTMLTAVSLSISRCMLELGGAWSIIEPGTCLPGLVGHAQLLPGTVLPGLVGHAHRMSQRQLPHAGGRRTGVLQWGKKERIMTRTWEELQCSVIIRGSLVKRVTINIYSQIIRKYVKQMHQKQCNTYLHCTLANCTILNMHSTMHSTMHSKMQHIFPLTWHRPLQSRELMSKMHSNMQHIFLHSQMMFKNAFKQKGKCRTNALAADKCNSTISMASLIEMHQQRLHNRVVRRVAFLGTTVSNNRIQVIAPKVCQEMLKRFLCLPSAFAKWLDTQSVQLHFQHPKCVAKTPVFLQPKLNYNQLAKPRRRNISRASSISLSCVAPITESIKNNVCAMRQSWKNEFILCANLTSLLQCKYAQQQVMCFICAFCAEALSISPRAINCNAKCGWKCIQEMWMIMHAKYGLHFAHK